jgi:hypothetical protein
MPCYMTFETVSKCMAFLDAIRSPLTSWNWPSSPLLGAETDHGDMLAGFTDRTT